MTLPKIPSGRGGRTVRYVLWTIAALLGVFAYLAVYEPFGLNDKTRWALGWTAVALTSLGIVGAYASGILFNVPAKPRRQAQSKASPGSLATSAALLGSLIGFFLAGEPRIIAMFGGFVLLGYVSSALWLNRLAQESGAPVWLVPLATVMGVMALTFLIYLRINAAF